MQLLGYRNINNTLIYTQLINFESDEFHVRIAKKLEEDKESVEAGLVCQRKRRSQNLRKAQIEKHWVSM